MAKDHGELIAEWEDRIDDLHSRIAQMRDGDTRMFESGVDTTEQWIARFTNYVEELEDLITRIRAGEFS